MNWTDRLFDRIKILGERIAGIYYWISERNELHEELMDEFDFEARESERLRECMLKDYDESEREISSLKKEMRFERLKFWKDMTELKRELERCLEEYKTEKEKGDVVDGK
ncbi:MAG: hypothetical protein B6U97_02970 [Candidatus Altiarchaeales archaeon ex4484_96]|nr:MAG: hypothetical protein B6U97_02970 [Candidatus Altiarchaeales archaeon ex4484_96]